MSTNRVSPVAKKGKCSCKGYNLDKLIQPQVLLLLKKSNEGLHGYKIIEAIRDGCSLHSVDSTGIYRTLKMMEQKEHLSAQWCVETGGPAKKVYFITESGEKCLDNWMTTLKSYKKSIEELIEGYQEIR